MDQFDQRTRDEIAEGERWLASLPTPPASPELIDRVKRTARGELGRLNSRSIQPRRWAPWHGAAAAAAAIALSVTVGWYSTTVEQNRFDDGLADNINMIDDYLALDPIDEGLADLGTLAAEEAWALSGSTLYEAMEEALADEPADEQNDMGASLPRQFLSVTEDVS